MERATNSFFNFLHVNREKTFRPKKKFAPGTLHKLHKQAEATLSAGPYLFLVIVALNIVN